MKKLIALLIVATLTSIASADPVKLTYNQAAELYVALNSVDSGLTPANIVATAENIAALRTPVEAYDKAKVSTQRTIRALPDNAERQAAAQKIIDQLDDLGAKEITVDLTRINLGDDEMSQAHIRPATLALIKLYLKAKPPETKK